jgi:hypothetical protein
MKSLLAFLLSCFVVILVARGWNKGQASANQTTNAGARVPVVLELFTSEGCSSCPPADALLAKWEEEQPVAGAEIIALEEHVDYWDHQGWNDPYSSAQWTQRQETYALGFKDHGVYTPELVVNGQTGFVASHQGDAYRAVVSAAREPRIAVSLTILPSEKRDHASVKVEVGKLQDEQPREAAEVWLAITEKALHTAVTGGENSGHELRHAAVVRSLHKAGNAERNAPVAFSGQQDLKVESGWKRQNLRVVAFVQEKHSSRILGAASVRLEQ